MPLIYESKKFLPDIFIAISIFSFFILAPNFEGISISFYSYDNKRIFELLIILLVYLVIIISHLFRNRFISFLSLIPKPAIYILFLVFSLAIISAWNAPSKNHAYLEVGLYIGLASLCISIATIARKHNIVFFSGLINTIAISIFIYEIGFITSYIASFVEGIPLYWQDLYAGFVNIRFLNQYMIWTLPLIALPLLSKSGYNKRYITFIFLIGIIWVWVLITTHSRGAIGAYIFSILFTQLIFKRHAINFFKINILLLFSGMLLYWLTMVIIPSGLNNFNSTTETQLAFNFHQFTYTQDRFDLWHNTIEQIIKKPFLGIGPMHSAWDHNNQFYHPHNSILQWAVELGMPSAILMLALTLWGIFSYVQRFKQLTTKEEISESAKNTWIAFFCSTIAGLTYSLVSGVIVMPLSQIMMAVVIACMLAIYYSDYEQNRKIRNENNYLLAIIMGLAFISLVYTALPDLIMRLDSSEYRLNSESHILRPRFWLVGAIPHK